MKNSYISDNVSSALSVKLRGGYRITHAPGWSESKTKIDYTLWYVTDGELIITVGGKDFNVRAGDVVVFSPGDSYSARSYDGCSFTFTFFALEMGRATDLLSDLCFSGILKYETGCSSAHLLEEFAKTRNASSKNGIELYALLLSYLSSLIDAAKRGELTPFYTDAQRVKNDEIGDIVKYISSNLSDGLRICDVAKHFNISEKNLMRKFNKSVGMSPKKYITQLKMERAIELIDAEGLKLSEVAAALGYSDQYAFSKAFKQFYEISPAEHRKMLR